MRKSTELNDKWNRAKVGVQLIQCLEEKLQLSLFLAVNYDANDFPFFFLFVYFIIFFNSNRAEQFCIPICSILSLLFGVQ